MKAEEVRGRTGKINMGKYITMYHQAFSVSHPLVQTERLSLPDNSEI